MSVGGTQQVMLKVRFAEMQRSVSKSLASSIAAQGTALNGNLGTTGGTGSLVSSGAVSNTFSGSTPTTNANNGAFLFGFNAGGLEVGILLEALEARGVVRSLAEPNLTALSGQEAKFLAGGEYPVPVTQDNGEISRHHQLGTKGSSVVDRYGQRLYRKRLYHQRLQAPRNIDHS